jgi:hypothetical protein
MNQVRARTASASGALRLFFIALAFLLLNLWNLVKASSYPLASSGAWPFPLAHWRLWLWEIVKQRLGFMLDLPVQVYL